MSIELKLSIIIPIYNAEKYIEKCLASIFKEIGTSKEVEVILIDDGSSDAGIDKCRAFLQYNIQIVKSSHKGVSAARNLGISQAAGEWLMFVDADDWLSPGWFPLLSAYFADDADIIIFNKDINEKIDKNILLLNIFGVEENIKLLAGPFSKLYRKGVLISENIYFNESIVNGEDMLFTAQFLLSSQSFRLCSESIYCYRVNMNSSTKRFDRRIIDSDRMFHELLKNMLIENEVSMEERQKIETFCIRNSIFILMQKFAYANSYKEIKECFSIFMEKPYCDVFIKNVNTKKDIIIFLVKKGIYRLAFLICRTHKKYKYYHEKEYIVKI